MALESATVAGLKVYRDGLIKVVGMAPGFGEDPNEKIVGKLAEYRKEIEFLLPNKGDNAASLPPLAIGGLNVVRELPKPGVIR